jgi:23S rRNA pseudouridine2457 synthase
VLTQFTQPPGSDKKTLADFGFPKSVYPLGRLDYDSEGLLLLSDDANLNQALLDPINAHQRVYLAQIENVPTTSALAALAAGVKLSGRQTAPARVKLLDSEPQLPPRPVPIRFRKEIPTAWIELTLTEGRNRQVRKMTAAVGYPTLRLIRVAIGSLKLLDLGLSPGDWRKLLTGELQSALGQVNRA